MNHPSNQPEYTPISLLDAVMFPPLSIYRYTYIQAQRQVYRCLERQSRTKYAESKVVGRFVGGDTSISTLIISYYVFIVLVLRFL